MAQVYASIEEMFGKAEPLVEELAECIEETDSGLVFLKHPLITSMYTAAMNPVYNAQLEARKKHIAEIEAKEDWLGAIWIYERPWRLHAFVTKYAEKLPIHAAADLLTEIWKDTEFPNSQYDMWLRLFRHYAPHSAIMKSSKGHLPTVEFEIYRGMTHEEDETEEYGMSWTIDRTVGTWFAKRFGQEGLLKTARIAPEHVFAYLPERAEQEVVIDPDELRV